MRNKRINRTLLLVAILILLSISIGSAKETSSRHVIWLEPQFSFPSGLDEGFSLYPRSGPAIGAELGYDYRGKVIVNEFGLGGRYIWLDAPYELQEKDLGVQLKVWDRVLFPIVLKNEAIMLYAGAAVGMTINVWFPQDRLNFSYQNALSLDALFRVEWNFAEKHVLRAGIALPVLGVSWRPAWAAYTTEIERSLSEDGLIGPLFYYPKFFSLHNLQSISFDLRYTWMLSPLLNLYSDYGLMYLHDASARPYQLIDHLLGIGVELKI